MSVNCETWFAMAVIARWAGLGGALRPAARLHSYQPHTNAGSRSKAYGVASSAASNFSQRPVCLSRKVGIPLSAETPAPVRTATRVAARSAFMILASMRVSLLEWRFPLLYSTPRDLNYRFRTHICRSVFCDAVPCMVDHPL